MSTESSNEDRKRDNNTKKDPKLPNIIEEFKVIKLLGSGSFGRVYLGMHLANDAYVAIKHALPGPRNCPLRYRNFLKNEVVLLKQLNHPNILNCYKERGNTYMVTEYVGGGDLNKLLKERKKAGKGRLRDEEVAEIIRHVLSGLRHIHANEIVHRDIKPVPSSLNYKEVKIIDFGLAAQFHFLTKKTLTQNCGTLAYMAPERTANQSYSRKVDIYSVGIMMYELMMGDLPIKKLKLSKKSFVEMMKTYAWELPEGVFSRHAKNFFEKTITKEPKRRYNVEDALNHPWITRNFDSEIPLTATEQAELFYTKLKFKKIFKVLAVVKKIQIEAEYEKNEQKKRLRKNRSRKRFKKKLMRKSRSRFSISRVGSNHHSHSDKLTAPTTTSGLSMKNSKFNSPMKSRYSNQSPYNRSQKTFKERKKKNKKSKFRLMPISNRNTEYKSQKKVEIEKNEDFEEFESLVRKCSNNENFTQEGDKKDISFEKMKNNKMSPFVFEEITNLTLEDSTCEFSLTTNKNKKIDFLNKRGSQDIQRADFRTGQMFLKKKNQSSRNIVLPKSQRATYSAMKKKKSFSKSPEKRYKKNISIIDEKADESSTTIQGAIQSSINSSILSGKKHIPSFKDTSNIDLNSLQFSSRKKFLDNINESINHNKSELLNSLNYRTTKNNLRKSRKTLSRHRKSPKKVFKHSKKKFSNSKIIAQPMRKFAEPSPQSPIKIYTKKKPRRNRPFESRNNLQIYKSSDTSRFKSKVKAKQRELNSYFKDHIRKMEPGYSSSLPKFKNKKEKSRKRDFRRKNIEGGGKLTIRDLRNSNVYKSLPKLTRSNLKNSVKF